jgi:hypothetical protein
VKWENQQTLNPSTSKQRITHLSRSTLALIHLLTLRDSVDEATFNSPTFDDLVISIKRKDEYLRMRDGNYSHTIPSVAKPPFKTSNSNTPSSPSGQFRVITKLTDAERQYLKDNKGCYRCREVNVNHVAANCPKFINRPANVVVKKEESVSQVSAIVSEFESSESYPPSSIPPIPVSIEVDGIPAQSIPDTGATVNVLSEDLVRKRHLRTIPGPRVLLRQPLTGKNIGANERILKHVSIPSVHGLASFVVAPLANTDAILGMPFLSQERILLDPANRKIILPDERKLKTMKTESRTRARPL